ncbi:ArsR/SmtB family transcription factor [Kitasatospora sp. NPDC056327]|uniref:ArsR/SmtB family transcription factor n=1 Tax=Kitasatospora sp. NPDC056327 TaxID=3345785 RepID=UPI0035D553AA
MARWRGHPYDPGSAVLRIHFTPEDFGLVRLAPRPAPLQELHAALLTLTRPGPAPLLDRWRRRTLSALPPAAVPLADLAPGGRAPVFLDVVADSLAESVERVRAAPSALVTAELARVYAPAPAPAPAWVHELPRGDAGAWRLVERAQRAAFDTVVGPAWERVRELHHAEFVRQAVRLAEDGAAALLPGLLPGSRTGDGRWEVPGAAAREVRLGGRGLLLLPTFHWSGGPLLSDPPDGPVVLTYPAGTGLPPQPDEVAGPEALARVLGGTRAELLHLLAADGSTGGLARRLGVSGATVSAHTAALRAAGLITTERAGKAVLHRRTALGELLVRPAAEELRSEPDRQGRRGPEPEPGPGPGPGPGGGPAPGSGEVPVRR